MQKQSINMNNDINKKCTCDVEQIETVTCINCSKKFDRKMAYETRMRHCPNIDHRMQAFCTCSFNPDIPYPKCLECKADT